MFWVCDSDTSYPLKGEIYIRKQLHGGALNANNVQDLVKRLVRPWQNTRRNVTMDFTSCELVISLQSGQWWSVPCERTEQNYNLFV